MLGGLVVAAPIVARMPLGWVIVVHARELTLVMAGSWAGRAPASTMALLLRVHWPPDSAGESACN